MNTAEYKSHCVELENYLCEETKGITGSKARWYIDSGYTLVQLEMMANLLEESIIESNNAYEKAVIEFEAFIQDTIAMGAGDRKNAIRWILEAEDDSIRFIEYKYKLPYNYLQGE